MKKTEKRHNSLLLLEGVTKDTLNKFMYWFDDFVVGIGKQGGCYDVVLQKFIDESEKSEESEDYEQIVKRELDIRYAYDVLRIREVKEGIVEEYELRLRNTEFATFLLM